MPLPGVLLGALSPEAAASAPVGVGADSERCSSCSTRRALAWRRDAVSKQVKCNRCYLQGRKLGPPDSGLPLAGEKARQPGTRAKRITGGDIGSVAVEDHEASSEVASGSGAAVDLSGYPAKIRVEGSPYERLNGIYSRAADPLNGRPYYDSQCSRKVTQLFLHGKEWKFGNMNKSGFFAKVRADKAQSLPTEPHPSAWKVLCTKHDGSKETLDAPAMRVIDLDLDAHLPAEAHLPAQPAEKDAQLLDGGRTARSSKRRRIGDLNSGGIGPVAEQRTQAGEPADRDGLEDVKDTKSEESTQDASGSESDSESSSSSSGSERSAGTTPPKANTATVAEVGVLAAVVYDHQQAGRFKDKLQSALQKATTKECRSKLRLISQRRQVYAQIASMTIDDLMAFCDSMYEKYGKPVPKPPPGEPPRHLLEKAGLLLPTTAPPSSTEGTAARISAGASMEVGELLPHRDPKQRAPKKGCLLTTHLGKFNPQAKRISFFDSGSGDQYAAEAPRVSIESMQPFWPHLWFQQPGAMVTCDACENAIPRNFGCPTGDPGLSQFAQHAFVCLLCLGSVNLH